MEEEINMAHIVILGAGLGGMPMAYEMRESVRPGDKVTVISNNPKFHFVPSNPWVAVNWRKRDAIELEIAPLLAKKKVDFIGVGAKRVHPEKNQIELDDGRTVDYDYLVIATGAKLAFEEVEGLGPNGHTHSICHVDHAVKAEEAWQEFVKNPGHVVVGAVQMASCYGPAYEFAMIMDTDLRKRKIRDKVPMTFVTAGPYISHLGLGASATRRDCSSRSCATATSNGFATPRPPRSRPARCTSPSITTTARRRRSMCLNSNSMMLPAFKGIDAVIGIEGLTNPRGFILIDQHQRNPKFKNIYAVGVCVAIRRWKRPRCRPARRRPAI